MLVGPDPRLETYEGMDIRFGHGHAARAVSDDRVQRRVARVFRVACDEFDANCKIIVHKSNPVFSRLDAFSPQLAKTVFSKEFMKNLDRRQALGNERSEGVVRQKLCHLGRNSKLA